MKTENTPRNPLINEKKKRKFTSLEIKSFARDFQHFLLPKCPSQYFVSVKRWHFTSIEFFHISLRNENLAPEEGPNPLALMEMQGDYFLGNEKPYFWKPKWQMEISK